MISFIQNDSRSGRFYEDGKAASSTIKSREKAEEFLAEKKISWEDLERLRTEFSFLPLCHESYMVTPRKIIERLKGGD